MWEATTSHARTCAAGDKVYAYAGQHGFTIYVNDVCDLVRIERNGMEHPQQQLRSEERAYMQQLWVETYEQRDSLQEADAVTLLHGHAAAAAVNLPMLQHTQVVLPLPLTPGTSLWFQNMETSEIDVQIDELSPANFTF